MGQLADLARPFPNHLIKDNPSGGGSYVPHPAYTQRLLLVCGGYSFEVVQVIRGDVAGKAPDPASTSKRARQGTPDLTNVVVGVMMRLTLEVDGKRCVYENVGDCEQPHNWDTDGRRLKDAVSDAKKRCCADAGLGLHLYFKEQKDYVLRAQLKEVSAGPSGGGESSGQTLVAGNPAGESKDPAAPANPSQAPSGSRAGASTVTNGGTGSPDVPGSDVGTPALDLDQGRSF